MKNNKFISKQQNNLNKNKNLQILVTEDKKQFIIVEKNNNITTLISPFQKSEDDIYSSNFILPENRTHRVSQLRSLIPKLAKFTTYSDVVNLDCLENIPEVMFDNLNEGIIHINLTTKNEKIKNTEEFETLIEAVDKMLLKKVENDVIKLNIKSISSFKTEGLKVLPVILNEGFIVSINDKEEYILYITLKEPKKNFIGNCSKREACNIVKYFYNIWPIFEINIKNKAKISLDTNIKLNFIQEEPILLKLTKKVNEEKTNIEIIGISE